jgi:hypothetical protein
MHVQWKVDSVFLCWPLELMTLLSRGIKDDGAVRAGFQTAI